MNPRHLSHMALWAGALFAVPALDRVCGAELTPTFCTIRTEGESVAAWVHIPGGYRHAVLEARSSVDPNQNWEPWISGSMNGSLGVVLFQMPRPTENLFFRVRLGVDTEVPHAPLSGEDHFAMTYGLGNASHDGTTHCWLGDETAVAHILNRLGYGVSPSDLERGLEMGLEPFLGELLQADPLAELNNPVLNTKTEALFEWIEPAEETFYIRQGDPWRYFKGTSELDRSWRLKDFDDSAWESGPSGFGYGDDDDATELLDMRSQDGQSGYASVYLRKSFFISNPSAVSQLILTVDYDDSFVAYLNGTEIARANVTGRPPLYNTLANDQHEAGEPEEFDLTPHLNLLIAGENLLAVQGHNVTLNSSDFSLNPQVLERRALGLPPLKRIKGIQALQHLMHVRGVYGHNQLQIALAEFWENHFCTDYDKLADYFYDLRNSDGNRAMSQGQANAEAAFEEYQEYEFFYENALGNFGDLLLFSATSPPMLVYLDSVLNDKEDPNENYAREVLELYAFGVDNRYVQADIEELARCFTGWSVRKVWPQDKADFPESALNPPTEDGVKTEDTIYLDVGRGWKYFKGTREPSPSGNGTPTIDWTTASFNDQTWLDGATSIGYGDGDDATVLNDMRNGYVSVYLRREFTLPEGVDLEKLVLSMVYDDGFVAYINGTEVARSDNLAGMPPAFDRVTDDAKGGADETREEIFSLRSVAHLLRPAPESNLLAIQVHNVELTSSDLSVHPRILTRQPLPESIENGNPHGVWTFRYHPESHDTGEKVLFRGTPHEIRIASRPAVEGIRDAVDVLQAMVQHPSTREFICLKLIGRFVSDEMNLASFQDRSAPEDLLKLMDEALMAWQNSQPQGNIADVLRVILDPARRANAFWSEAHFRSKIKSPIEFINSGLRILEADLIWDENNLPNALSQFNQDMGMAIFTRDDPDGYPEVGLDWMGTSTLLERIRFSQILAENRNNQFQWNSRGWMAGLNLETPDRLIDAINLRLFQGTLSDQSKAVLRDFITTDTNGNPMDWNPAHPSFLSWLEDLIGLALSVPDWQYQ